mgnify:CR=1 FL=1
MTKLFLSLLAITITSMVFAQPGQISNGGFESWQNDTLYQDPTDWRSSNTDRFFGIPTVTRSNDAADGSYSALITPNKINQDTLAGNVYLGEIGPAGPQKGVPYTDNFEAITIYYKSDLQINDSLYVIMVRFYEGNIVDYQIKPFAFGLNNTWTPTVIFVGNTLQDSLFIGFSVGTPTSAYSPQPESWATIDNIQFISGGNFTSNLPNNSFENWTDKTTENPNDWYSLNYLLAGHGLENAVKTTDANTGNFALQMSTVTSPIGTVPGFIGNGTIDFYNTNVAFLPQPYTAIPTDLTGAFKYTPSGIDTATIQLVFYENNVAIGYHKENLISQPTYTNFSSSFSIFGNPDSLVFLIYSGDNIGSTLFLDDLSFSGGGVGLSELTDDLNVLLYPNPASNVLNIKLPEKETYSIRINNLLGKTVIQLNNYSGLNSISTDLLEKGSYLVSIFNDTRQITKVLVIQ